MFEKSAFIRIGYTRAAINLQRTVAKKFSLSSTIASNPCEARCIDTRCKIPPSHTAYISQGIASHAFEHTVYSQAHWRTYSVMDGPGLLQIDKNTTSGDPGDSTWYPVTVLGREAIVQSMQILSSGIPTMLQGRSLFRVRSGFATGCNIHVQAFKGMFKSSTPVTFPNSSQRHCTFFSIRSQRMTAATLQRPSSMSASTIVHLELIKPYLWTVVSDVTPPSTINEHGEISLC